MRNTKIEINTVRIYVSLKEREEIRGQHPEHEFNPYRASCNFFLLFLVTKIIKVVERASSHHERTRKKATDLFLLFTQSSYLWVIVVRPFPLTLPF